jgi:hypothetical protein
MKSNEKITVNQNYVEIISTGKLQLTMHSKPWEYQVFLALSLLLVNVSIY